MASLMSRPKQVERNKRFLFMGVGAAGLFSTFFVSGWIGIPLLGYSAYLGWKWLLFRAKNGLRF